MARTIQRPGCAPFLNEEKGHAGTRVPNPRPSPTRQAPWCEQLYFWVLTAIVAGILTGWLCPSAGTAMEPVGMTFVAAIKILITRSSSSPSWEASATSTASAAWAA
jgi:hypothetical protein